MRTTTTAATQLVTTTSGATSRKKYAAAPAPIAVASRIVSRLTAEAALAVCASAASQARCFVVSLGRARPR